MTAPTTHWGKLYGSLCLHPKWLATPAEGRALWTSALSYCIVIGSDGDIPEGVLHMLNAPGSDVATSVQQLLDSGLWTRSDKGYRFHDWDDFQQTVAERKDVRRKRSEAGKASAEARRKAKSDDPTNTSPTSVGTPVQQTINTGATEKRREEERREEERREESAPPVPRRAPERPLPEDWEPTDTHKATCQEGNFDLAYEVKRFREYAYANDRRQRNWNSAFSMWLTNAKPRPKAIPSGRPSQGSWMVPRKAA